jgi:hypothetical protein
MDKVGVSSNSNNEETIATAFSIAKTNVDQYYLNNQNDFKAPKYVKTLPPRQQLRGKIETIDEVPSVTDYYDGTLKFKTRTVTCNQWTTQKEACQSQKSCGWCWSSLNCIPGNNLGPLAPCLRGKYEYTAPEANWNPLESNNVNISRQNIGGAQLTTITPK